MSSSIQEGAGPRLVSYPVEGAFRVARREEPLGPSWISAPDAQMSSGNRYDIAGGGVLYCATQLEACYAETLARFRPSPGVIERLGAFEAGRMNIGSVPADWRLRRVKARVLCEESLPFVDVEDPLTLAFLGKVLEKDLLALDIQQPLDVSLMRGRDRRIPRLVSRWAYNQQDESGSPVFSGLRYESKLGKYECWAIFDGTPVRGIHLTAVSKDDPELMQVANMFGLTLH